MKNIPITQSEEWQKLQDALGEKSFYIKTQNYQYLAIKKHTPVGNYLFLPYGPVANSSQDMKLALQAVEKLAREEHCIFVRVEPQLTPCEEYLPQKADKTKDISPSDTWVLDLTPDKEALVKGFSQGTRTRYNTYSKKGLVVEKTKDPALISHLVELQAKLFQKKHLVAYDADYLESELRQPFATLYIVKYLKSQDSTRLPVSNQSTAPEAPVTYPPDGQVLAVSLFFDYEGTRYYMQSAADLSYRRLPATVALLSEAIFDAKEKGIKRFDFWGIAPDGASANHPWYGFTEFKKSFGGSPVHYAGTYDIVLQPMKYKLFTRLNHLKRKLA